jgi:DNA polymerase-4/protein ImuB
VWRLGWARGKFASWVAATRAKPGEPVIVSDDRLNEFLKAQRIGTLPLDPDTHRRLWQLGLRILGDLIALPEQAVVSQFGREGRLAWRLATGTIVEPVIGKEAPQPIMAAVDFPTPIADQSILTNTISRLTDQALRHPRRAGWRVRSVRVRATLEHGSSWMIDVILKDPSASREHITTPLITKLEQTPPTGGVEHLAVEFTAFVRGTKELQLFARDAVATARTGQRRALRWAAHEIKTRLKRSMLYHIIEVHPWSRIPERRYALIDFDP